MKDLKLSLQLLLQKLNKLVVANENLLNKQFVFAEKSSLDYRFAELQEWINPKLDVANDLAVTFLLKLMK